MSYGIQVYQASGALLFDTSNSLGRILGYGQLSWATSETGIKSLTFPGLISSDVVFCFTNLISFARYSTSVSGTTVSINVTTAAAGLTMNICVVRPQ